MTKTSLMGSSPTLSKIHQLLGCKCFDSVTLDSNGTVMIVDDTGIIDNKPVNAKATKLYLGICRPGATGEIRGDVAIVNDNDF